MTSVQSNPIKTIIPSQYVGFDTIPQQIQTKLLQRGFRFNLMVVGKSGLGKSTLVNTLFASPQMTQSSETSKVPQYNNTDSDESLSQTTSIHTKNYSLEENGVHLDISITDTPGYGDQVNNENCWEPVIKHIKDQYAAYLKRELNPVRERFIIDTRIHCILFFISPSGHSLTPLDITVLKKISEVANVIPVIAKSDSLTPLEKSEFKKRIRDEFLFHEIKLFTHNSSKTEDDFVSYWNLNNIPFSIVGSDKVINVNGKLVRGRNTRAGVINVDDPQHCEFSNLKHFLMINHLHDLIESTSLFYESFRTKQLLALKESQQWSKDNE